MFYGRNSRGTSARSGCSSQRAGICGGAYGQRRLAGLSDSRRTCVRGFRLRPHGAPVCSGCQYTFTQILTTTIMTEETNIVAVYPDHDAAEQAVSKLRDASFDVTKLSIIGKDYHTDEKVVGYYT